MKLVQKQKVIELRKIGKTISEIQKIVPVSKSSISLWIEGIKLSKQAQVRISEKISLGQLKSREVLKQRSIVKSVEIDNFSKLLFSRVKLDQKLRIILCACLYECEGGKGLHQSLSFTNSDPKMVKIFLKLLRDSFKIDETKFSVCIHLHSYHDKNIQLKFWSKVTGIPYSQFIKPFIKNNSGLYKKEGYAGCISIRYYDISLKRKLLAIFKELENNL